MAIAFLIVWKGFHNFVEYCFLGLLAIWLIRQWIVRDFRFKSTPIDWAVGGYLLWILITIPNAIDSQYSFSEWLKTCAHILLFYFVVNAIHTEAQVRHILYAAVAGMFVLSLIGIIQFIAQDGEVLSKGLRESSLTNSSQWFSTYLVMGIPIMLLGVYMVQEKGEIALYGIVSCSLLIALFLAHTRSSYIAISLQLLVLSSLYIFRRGFVIVGIMICFFAGIVGLLIISQWQEGLFPNNSLLDLVSMKRRLGTWMVAMNDILMNPLLGIGYGKNTFSFLHIEFGPGLQHNSVHNFFLSKAVQIGVPGVFAVMVIFGQILKSSFEVWNARSDEFIGRLSMVVLLMVIGVIVRNMFDDMLVGTLSYFFWLLVGLFFALQFRSLDGQPNRLSNGA